MGLHYMSSTPRGVEFVREDAEIKTVFNREHPDRPFLDHDQHVSSCDSGP